MTSFDRCAPFSYRINALIQYVHGIDIKTPIERASVGVLDFLYPPKDPASSMLRSLDSAPMTNIAEGLLCLKYGDREAAALCLERIQNAALSDLGSRIAEKKSSSSAGAGAPGLAPSMQYRGVFREDAGVFIGAVLACEIKVLEEMTSAPSSVRAGSAMEYMGGRIEAEWLEPDLYPTGLDCVHFAVAMGRADFDLSTKEFLDPKKKFGMRGQPALFFPISEPDFKSMLPHLKHGDVIGLSAATLAQNTEKPGFVPLSKVRHWVFVMKTEKGITFMHKRGIHGHIFADNDLNRIAAEYQRSFGVQSVVVLRDKEFKPTPLSRNVGLMLDKVDAKRCAERNPSLFLNVKTFQRK